MAPKPKRRENVMEKAARLQQEAVRLQPLGKYQILMRALKAEPQFVQDLYTQLEGVFSAKGQEDRCEPLA